jgi:hypothetical protein
MAMVPLEEFDARLIQAPLQGLLRNMDGELARQHKQSIASRNVEAERVLSLFLMLVRFTKNSYEATSFLCSTVDDNPKRKREFVLMLPPANRQLLDLLFSLVFMMDDFPARSMSYERSAYRQGREEYDKFYARFGSHPDWQSRFTEMRNSLQIMEKFLAISPEQQADPSQIAYWRAPYRLMKTNTKSQPFMEFLEKWLYGETSAQAHLNAGGLLSFGAYLLTDLAQEDQREHIERNFQGYVFRQFSRTLITVLGITSEIENYCSLGNRQALVNMWVLLGGYAAEAMDVYRERYQEMLSKP